MRLKKLYIVVVFTTFIAALLQITSCNTVNQVKYFKNLPDSSTIVLPHMDQEPRQIQVGDRLQIMIGAKNPEAAAVFNAYGDMPTSGGSTSSSSSMLNSDIVGFWVNENGYIEFPIIGKIKALGLTATQLKDTITARVSPYLRDPLVNVKFISFKFTVLGEVRNPGTFVISMQRTTLLDALGAAGDLPRSAKRYDILLYRDYNGKRVISKVDLRDKSLLTNPDLFQIRHNDILIIQPRNARLVNEELTPYLSILTLLLGTTALIISVTSK